jgi:undecaprenyl-diphosphatase
VLRTGSLDHVIAGAPSEEHTILPRPLRGPAGAVAAMTVLVAGLLTWRYAGGSDSRWLDRRLQGLVGSAGPGDRAPDLVIVLGHEVAVVVLAVLIGGVALALGQRRIALLAIVGPGLTGVATTMLKPAIGRTLAGEYAFPSGHTGGATALGVVTALLLIQVLRTATGASATLLAAGALVSGGTMAVALIAEGDHYPTDTVGGFCVAVAVVLASALVIDRAAERRRRRETDPGG